MKGQNNLVQNGDFQKVDMTYWSSPNMMMPNYPKKMDSLLRYWFDPADSCRKYFRFYPPCTSTFPSSLNMPQLNGNPDHYLTVEELVRDSSYSYNSYRSNSCTDRNEFLDNRSYATNLLKSKTEIGKLYSCSFFVKTPVFTRDTFYTNKDSFTGNASFRNSCIPATDGLGIAFTTYLPTQNRKHRLLIKPKWETPIIINHREWREYHFEFVADSLYQFMTVGIFKANKDLHIEDPVFYPYNQSVFDLVNSSGDRDYTNYSYDNFSLVLKIRPPKIEGPLKVCTNRPYKYYSGSGDATKWFYRGDTTPFYIGDSISINFTKSTTLIALNDNIFDSVSIAVFQEPVQLLNDTFFITNKKVTQYYPLNGFKYKWDNRTADTLQFKNYKTTGLKFVIVSNPACSIKDSFYIDSINLNFKILTDTSTCQLTSHVITSTQAYRNYTWQYNQQILPNTKTISLNYALPGLQKIKACFDTLGLSICDTISINVFEKPKSNLPKFLQFCEKTDNNICLQFNVPNTSFNWQDGSLKVCRNITNGGVYRIDMQNGVCITHDTLNANEIPIPKFEIIQNDTPCLDGNNFIVLRIVPDTFPSYKWLFDGSISSQYTTADTLSQRAIVTGTNGCYSSLKYKPLNGCNMIFYVPNSFSPNDDGANDIFNINGLFIGKIKMQIYNSWGELIFQTNDLNKGWDGTYENKICPQGNYLVTIELQSQPNQYSNKPVKFWKGIVQLLR
ncbi:MAG: gliding motility-associated C-terminal domain-containing protein [bacterium]|nr:gliding motility-associated C-terminal domain-containing protein [bacterium]